MKILTHIDNCYRKEIPFVAYKKPEDDILKCICQDGTELHKFTGLETDGFVFAPFDDREDAYIIPKDSFTEEAISVDSSFFSDGQFIVNNSSKKRHIDLVSKTIDAIQQTDLLKVVVSREEEAKLEDFEMVNVFKKMLHQYKSAFVYIWFHPKVGLWMGATPETLLKIEGCNFETMSLAGTQEFKGDLNPKWGSKELEEQSLVTRYIKENLESKVKELQLSDVETVKAGKLLHLKTKIRGVLNSKQDITTLIKLLHPTPAVCGLPKELSKAFILREENYARSFYTGYLGEINIKNKTSLYVNLRCFSYDNSMVKLYVGGGITKSSNPEKEWLETVAKSETIKRVLF
ncbi:chorismate-binding protein [Wenyingzhuangia sp. IMCC45533]